MGLLAGTSWGGGNSMIAIYPGTFDPFTLGHEDIVRRASKLFERVVICVSYAHYKKTLFSLEERVMIAGGVSLQYPNVSVRPFGQLLVEEAEHIGAGVIVRGIRAMSDFDYEFQMAGMNRALAPDLETVFLTPDANHQFVSGTFVRGIAELKGDVSKFVSPEVVAKLKAKFP